MPTTNGGTIKYGIQFDVNKSGLNQLTKSFQEIQNLSKKNPLDENLKKAASTAKELEGILNKSWNDKLNQLNLDKFNQSVKTSYGSVEELRSRLMTAGTAGQAAFNNMAAEVLNTNVQLRQSNKLLDDLATSMSNTVKWGITSSIFNNITSSIQQAYYYSKDLDRSLNNIRIVTGDSADQMDRFARVANTAAKDLGRSTLDYTKAALSFYQQGLGEEDVAARTAVTLKAQNITGAGSEMVDYLTAVWNGFQVTADQTEGYVDKLAKVADASASDMSQLAIAMSKVASTANVMGVDVDQLTAQLATVIATTRQAPEAVGTAFKTIYSRLNDIKAGTDDAEISLGNYSGQMAALGFNVLDASGKLRDTGQVIEQIGSRWSTLSKEQQVSLAQIMGGMRQVNQITALFQNWTMYSELLNDSLTAQGTLNEKNDVYLDSMAAHLEKLSAEAERTYDILFDPDTVNLFTDALNGVLTSFNDFIDGIGGGANAFAYFGSVVAGIFNNQIAQGIVGVQQQIQRVQANLGSLQAKASIINNIKANIEASYAGSGTSLGQNALQAQAEAAEKTLAVQRGLTAEQQKTAVEIQKQIGLTQQKIDDLQTQQKLAESRAAALRSQLELEGASQEKIRNRLQVRQEELKTSSELAHVLNTVQWDHLDASENQRLQSAGALVQKHKELLTFILNQHTAVQGADGKVNNIIEALKTGNLELEGFQNNWKEISTAINELNNNNNTEVNKLQTLLRSILVDNYQDVKIHKEKRDLLQEQNGALADQGKHVIDLQDKVKKVALAGQLLTTLGGALASGLDKSATSAQRLNAIFSGFSGTAAAVANYFAPGSGLIVQGVISLGQTLLKVTGIWDYFENKLKTSTEKVQEFHDKVAEINEINRTKNSQISYLESIQEEYARLSEKAGAYGSTIENLTDDEKQRYWELTDKFTSYNDAVIAGYDEQGHAIVRGQDALKDTIEVLKEAKRQAIASSLGDFNTAKNLFDEERQSRITEIETKQKENQDTIKELQDSKSKDAYKQIGADFRSSFNQDLMESFGFDDDGFFFQRTIQEANEKFKIEAGTTLQQLKQRMDQSFQQALNESGEIDINSEAWKNFLGIGQILYKEFQNSVGAQQSSELKTYADLLFNNNVEEWTQSIEQAIEDAKQYDKKLRDDLKEAKKLSEEEINYILDYLLTSSGGKWDQLVDTASKIGISQNSINSSIQKYLSQLSNVNGLEQGVPKALEYITKLQSLFTQYGETINLVIDEGMQEAADIVKNRDTSSAFDINEQIKQSIEKVFIGSKDIQDILKTLYDDDSTNDETANYIIDLIKNIYNLDDINFALDENNQVILENISNKTDQLIDNIVKSIAGDNTKRQEDVKGEVAKVFEQLQLPEDTIAKINNDIKNFKSNNIRGFRDWVVNYLNDLNQDTKRVSIAQNIDKVISDVNKIVSGKDLTWKDKYNDKTGLAAILDLKDEDLAKLETNEDWLEKIIEEVNSTLKKGSAERIAVMEAIYHDMDSIKNLDPNDEDYAQLWDTAFHNQLENLKINQAALREYAQIKKESFNSNDDKQTVLSMYKIEAGLSGLESQARSLQNALKDGNADLQTANFIGELTELFGGQLEGFDHNYIVEHIDAIVAVLGKGISSAQQFKEAVQNYDPTEQQEKSMQEYIDAYNSAASALLDGKTISQNQVNELLETIKTLGEKYPQLLQYVDILNNKWLQGTDQYTNALLEVQSLLSGINLQELIDDLDDTYVQIEVDPQDFDEWAEHVEDFLDIDRKIDIAVQSNMDEEFERMTQQLDRVYDAAGKIGQNFIVAAKDISELNTVFPGIIQGMQMLDDGSYQLNSNIAQRAISTAQVATSANAESIAQQLEDEAAYHDAKAAIYDDIARAAAVLAGDQTDSELTSAQARNVIVKKLAELKAKNSQKAAKQENLNQKEVADGSKQNADIVSKNWSGAAQSATNAIFIFAQSAVQNMAAVASSIAAGVNGLIPSDLRLSNPNINNIFSGVQGVLSKVTNSETSDIEDLITNPTSNNAKEIEKIAQNRANQERAAAERARGQAAQVRGRNRTFNQGMDNVTQGKGINPKESSSSKSSKGSKGSNSGSNAEKAVKQVHTEQHKLLDQTIDRYHDINNIIKQISRAIDRIEQQQKKLVGHSLVKSLQRELKLIQQQKKAQEQKLKLQREERKEIQDTLTQQGVSFNSDGTIGNYSQALQKAMTETNRVIAEYNKYIKQGDDLINGNPLISDESKNSIKASQDLYKKQIQAAEQKYKNFKETLDKYDKLVGEQIEDTKDNIQKLSDQEIEIKIKKSNVIVELRLQVEDFKRDWINFKKQVLEGISFQDAQSIFRSSSKNMDLIKTYYDPDAINEADKGTLYTTSKKVGELVQEIQKIKSGDYSGTYGNNIAQAYDDLKAYEEKAMNAAKALRDLVDEMADAVIKSIDQAKSAFDDHINQYKHVGKLLDHQAKIIQLLYGDNAHDLLDKYYAAQESNNNAQIDFLRRERAEWEQKLQAELAYRATLAQGTEEYSLSTEKINKFKQYLHQTIEDLNNEVENALQNLIDKYHNAINKAFADLESKLTNGKSLERVGQEWELINKHADMYLDNVNRIYQIDKLRNAYEKAVNDNQGNLKAQKSLTDMMQEQLKFLKDKEKISQYDIDRANTLLDIEVKRLALEEQRNQKTRLRLRRDAQGNYTYEYTGAEQSANEILEARQALRDAQIDLYNMTKQHYKEDLKDYYSTIEDMNERIKALYQDNTLSEQERNERVLQIRRLYEPILNDLAKDNIELRENLYNDAVDVLSELYAKDAQNFKLSADEIQKKVEETINGDSNGIVALWNSGIQQMIDKISAEGGLNFIYDQAMTEMNEATAQLRQSIDLLEETAGQDFDRIDEYIEQAQNQTDELKDKNQDLITTYDDLMRSTQQLCAQALRLWDAFLKNKDGMRENINKGADLINSIEAVTAAYEDLQDAIERAADAAANADFTIETTYIEHHITDNQTTGGGGYSGGYDYGGGSDYVDNTQTYDNNSSSVGYGGPSKSGVGYSRGIPTPRVSKVEVRTPTANGWWTERITYTDDSYEDRRTNKSFSDKVGAVKGSFDTGGYTGSWGSDGKLAMLHEKELVLNKEDTQNILSAVDIVRTLDSLSKNIQDNTQAANYVRALGSFDNSGSGMLDQNVKIQAHFPNVSSSSEIEEAFNNLVNRASQYAFKHSY